MSENWNGFQGFERPVVMFGRLLQCDVWYFDLSYFIIKL